MCKNSKKRCKIADLEKVMRLRNGTGPPHGQRAQRAGEFYGSNVYEVIVNFATGCFFYERRRREE